MITAIISGLRRASKRLVLVLPLVASLSFAQTKADINNQTFGNLNRASTSLTANEYNYAAGGGTAQAQTVTLSPAITALTVGFSVWWKPLAANTAAAPTLAANGFAATAITKCGTIALVANDLITTAIAHAVYDGTQFELTNPQSFACGSGSGMVYPAAGIPNSSSVAWSASYGVAGPGSTVVLNESTLTNVAGDISALSSGGVILISPTATGTITGTITVANPNVTVKCLSNAPVFTRAASQSFAMFEVTSAGTGFTLDGCNINMNGGTGVAVLADSGSSNLNVRNNTINGTGSTSSQGIQLNGTITALILGNVITSGGIFGQGNTQNIRVEANDITNTAFSAIEFHSTTSGQIVKQLTVHGNHIHAQGTFCVEIGSFNGAAPTDIVVSTNECDMIGAGSGGYSFGAVIGGSMTNNTFNAGAQTTGISAFEFAPSLVNATSGVQVGCLGGTAVGNTSINGGVSLNEASDVTVTTNTITISNGLEAIYVGGAAGLSSNNNNITNNVLVCAAACTTSGGKALIWMQANNATEQVNNNSVAQNTFIGSGVGNFEAGVYGEDDTGAMTGNQVTGNNFNNIWSSFWFNNAGAASIVTMYGNSCVTVTNCPHAGGTNVTNVVGLASPASTQTWSAAQTFSAGLINTTLPFDDQTSGMTTAAMTAANSATLTAITGMTWSVAASKNYLMRCEIPVLFVASATIGFGLVGPGTPTSYTLDAYGLIGAAAVFGDVEINGQTTWVSTKTGSSGAPGAVTEIIHVNAAIQNGATAGTLTLDSFGNAANNYQILANAVCRLMQQN